MTSILIRVNQKKYYGNHKNAQKKVEEKAHFFLK